MYLNCEYCEAQNIITDIITFYIFIDQTYNPAQVFGISLHSQVHEMVGERPPFFFFSRIVIYTIYECKECHFSDYELSKKICFTPSFGPSRQVLIIFKKS